MDSANCITNLDALKTLTSVKAKSITCFVHARWSMKVEERARARLRVAAWMTWLRCIWKGWTPDAAPGVATHAVYLCEVTSSGLPWADSGRPD